MSLFDYQPGELSLLLNPSAQPDVYQRTKPALPKPSKSNKRTNESAEQHDRQHKKKKVDKAAQPNQHDEQQPASRKHKGGKQGGEPQAASETTDVDASVDRNDDNDEPDVNDDDDEGGEAEQDGDDDDDEGELSDLSDLDDTDLYADMDASTARQLRKQKRLLDDQQAEQPHVNPNKKANKPTASPAADPRLPRTLFAGNVPAAASRQQLTRFFRQYGAVESVRLRSFSTSNPKLPKRAAIIRGAIHPERQSLNAYVVFEEEAGVEKAVADNGVEYEGHRLRLDYADRSRSAAGGTGAGVAGGVGLSVFVGNLPFSVSEQQLYDVFDGCGTITGVRVVRDPLLALGKGFAFVTFADTTAVKKALAMQGAAIDGRELRLTKAMDETKAREIRDKRRNDAQQQPAAAGAARRVQEKVKHGERKAAAAAVARRGEKKGKVYVGEVSNPLEFVQKARRVEKAQKLKKVERRKKRSLVKVKKPRMKKAEGDNSGASSKAASTKRKDQS